MPGATAHGVGDTDQGKLESGGAVTYLYQGAKHMVTGYDHLLFLVGVIFFLYHLRDVLIYVSFFTLGHSATLLLGVLADIQANAFLIDAVIGLSVVYKGFENLGGFERLGWRLDQRAAVLVFGLFHGFGLATKLQDLDLPADGLVGNMLAFNVGVELGQVLALCLVFALLMTWRRHASYMRHAMWTNLGLMSAGFVLFGMQMTGYVTH